MIQILWYMICVCNDLHEQEIRIWGRSGISENKLQQQQQNKQTDSHAKCSNFFSASMQGARVERWKCRHAHTQIWEEEKNK